MNTPHDYSTGPKYNHNGAFYQTRPGGEWLPVPQTVNPWPPQLDPAKSRGVYIVLALLLGGLGIHNFYAGRFGAAIGQLLITLLTGWLIVPLLVVGLWALIDACAVTTDGRGRPFA